MSAYYGEVAINENMFVATVLMYFLGDNIIKVE